jgi:putative membrane protein insertion efficiency factor
MKFKDKLMNDILAIHKIRMAKHSDHVCIFSPSCSEYMTEAIKIHGFIKGIILGLKRLSRCNSELSSGGLDPVPPRPSEV